MNDRGARPRIRQQNFFQLPITLAMFTVLAACTHDENGPRETAIQDSKAFPQPLKSDQIAQLLVGKEMIIAEGPIKTSWGPEYFGSDGSYSRRADLGTVTGTYSITNDQLCVLGAVTRVLVCRQIYADGDGNFFTAYVEDLELSKVIVR